jgi:AcrR family transcriptional regulator
MPRSGRPRLHTHLSRESIARAGLEVVDRRGLEALSLRTVAATLGVGTMTLYGHTPDRESLERDIVGLLLDEVDVREVPGETWDDTIRRVARSLREMTLRHPHAFPLVAAAPVFESPVLEYAARIQALHAHQGLSRERFVAMWSVCDAFFTGFMVMLAQAAARTEEGVSPVGSAEAAPSRRTGATSGPEDGRELAEGLADVLSEAAFERDLEVVLAGLRVSGMTEGAHRPD